MTQPDKQRAGLRRRIVEPAPPAPVPVPRTPKPDAARAEGGKPDRSLLTTSPKGETIAPPVPAETTATGAMSAQGEAAAQAAAATAVDAAGGGAGAGRPGEEGTSNEEVVRATGSMAVATLISRITGFIRTVLIGAALGPAVASAFNTANTLPNLITEIVLGSVLTALVVPVLVRAEKEDADHGAAFIRRLFTLTLTLMTAVTLLAVVGAPLLAELMVDEDSKVNLVQTTSFAYLLLPQIFFYGTFSLFMAVLNTKEHFRPGAWAPVANNLVSIAVLVAYMALPGSLNPAAPASISNPHVLLLGVGTTLGVVVQCLIMLPALKKLGIDLRPLWGIDERLKQFGGMALAIITYVAISQLGYVVTTRIAANADAAAPIIYQQHWMLLQMPYGIIGVTLLTAIMPRLSRNAADGDDKAVVDDLTMGTKLTFIALIPIIIFMSALGPDIGRALFAYGSFDPEAADTLGLTIAFSAFTLIPYALVMLHLRVFYAREEAWTPTFIIAGITGTKVVLSYLAPMVADSPEHVVVLLGAANGFGFVAGALIGGQLLRHKLGTLEVRSVLRTSAWAIGAGLVGIALTLGLRWLLRDAAGVDLARALAELIGAPSLGLLIEVALLGTVFVAVTGLVLSRSKLPEVQNLAGALARIPGLNRLISPDEELALDTGVVDPRDVSNQFLASDTFNASPVPPPLSAGVVRGPRLVPGALVSDGRFRLIRDHGATTGARFWQAREVATGRPVALTFVDTTGASPLMPASPREAAIEAAGVARRTRKLAKLNHPAIADNIEVLSYRSGALIVADWVEGTALKAVAESGQTLHTEAVANALAPLAGALAAAHSSDVPVGLDNRQRLRVDTDGKVRVAFPAVLPESTAARDASAFASALGVLTANVNSRALDELVQNTRALVDAGAIEPHDFRDIQAALRREANLPGTVTAAAPARPAGGSTIIRLDHLEPAEEPREPAEVRGGFGARRYRPITVVALTALAVASVVAIAALTTYLVGFISGDDTSGPVNQESVQGVTQTAGSQTPTSRALPVVIGPLQAQLLVAPDAPDTPPTGPVAHVADGDTATTFTAPPGSTLLLRPRSGESFALEHVLVDASSATPYQVLGLPAGVADDPVAALAGGSLPVLAEGTLHAGQNNIDAAPTGADAAQEITAVLLAFPADEAAELREVSVIGYTQRG
ncbi:murein biosynthesis integral membrane protein MurJ [Corynebacterium bouchesdurhonense]|uniref:murein biosynthesis integral membrane protein MurJ n=1 Tax=Corynebacterium bouchesdurhonense TaxID=1720192 RepID=UPI0008326E0F|nr:murein biosynthesis integral membrane protein MurJ [Corynebacterium bouchesdurhonense]